MLSALLVMIGLAVALGLVLGFASLKFRVEGNPLVEKVDAVLPQIQCGQCGYPGCKPYAEAISAGNTPINLCAPGGEATMLRLADLLGVEPQPVAAEHAASKPRQVAFIDEQTCIGCTLCFQACPVDAIVGAAKQMHTIISSECTGCELCLPPCPVGCITMLRVDEGAGGWKWQYPVYPIHDVSGEAEVTA